MFDSVESSPVLLAFAQLVVLILSALIYGRQKNALDVEKRDRGAFGGAVERALGLATDAKQEVERINVDHYKKLATMFAECCAETEALKAKVRAQEESIASLSNKLASRERADKSAEKKAAKEAAVEDPQPGLPTAPGAAGVDDLVRQGLAIPLGPQQPGPVGRRRPFGQPL